MSSSRWRLILAVLFGIAGGLLSSVAYPSNALWIAIIPAVALILYAISLVKPSQAIVVGFFAGVAFYASQIPWMTVYLGPVPWLALSILEGVIFAVGSWAIGLTLVTARNFKTKFSSNLVIALLVACLWTAREWVAISFPYGGFPWSRVALSQSNSPLAPWVFWGGNSLITFVLVLAAALVVFGYKDLVIRRWHRSASALSLILVFVIPVVTPLDNRAEVGTLDVAAVQGNAKAGLLVYEPLGKILQNHLDASAPLLADANKPELVVWPENAADKNPDLHADADTAISYFTDSMGVPLMFGTITERDGEVFNSSILWFPEKKQVDFYDKKRPVAFGEYVPDREFYRMLAPDLIDLIPRGYSFGTRDGIFMVNDKKVGTMICFEVAVDDISRDLVAQGATILIAQTNNSDFGRTNQSSQQLSIARLRAIETGRAMVHISTVGTSAIILPDGTVAEQLPTYTADILRQDLPLRTSITPAMMFGATFELANNFAALGIVLFSIVAARRKRRGQ